MSRMALKLIGAVAGVVVLASLLTVTILQARTRGDLAHCRNNLRHLGGLAVREWDKTDSETARNCRGRLFWQWIRVRTYQNERTKEWRRPVPDPFVCPVLGSTRSNEDDSRAIDYRGPRQIAYDESRDLPEALSHGRPLGADRVGNHGAGGHVVFRDLSVPEERRVDLSAVSEGDALWTRAASELTD